MIPTAAEPVHIEIVAGGYRASLDGLGATLRRLTLDDRDLIVPFDADAVRPFFRGAVLAPWPNRVVDGRYTFAGVEQQLAITEPSRGHALHGLVTWQEFGIVSASVDRVTFEAVVPAQAGYPHRVRVNVEYRVDEGGLHTTVTGTNLGGSPAPWGTGPHPYLVAGEGHVDDWTLTVPAASVLEVTPDRLVPTGLAPVTSSDGGIGAAPGSLDFRGGRVVADTFVDHAYSDLIEDASGRVTVRVTARDGRGVAMTWGSQCPWVQVHTADQPDPAVSRIGLAVEPMTCAPDAFNAGETAGLMVIEPGGSAEAGWTIAGF